MEQQNPQPLIITPEAFEKIVQETCKARSEPGPVSVAVGKLIEQKGEELIDLAKAYLERGERQEVTKYRYWFRTVLAVSVIAIFMLSMVLVAFWRGLITQEGLTFLLGTLAGYIFGILSSVIGMAGFKSSNSHR